MGAVCECPCVACSKGNHCARPGGPFTKFGPCSAERRSPSVCGGTCKAVLRGGREVTCERDAGHAGLHQSGGYQWPLSREDALVWAEAGTPIPEDGVLAGPAPEARCRERVWDNGDMTSCDKAMPCSDHRTSEARTARCYMCATQVPEAEVKIQVGVGPRCIDRDACRLRSRKSPTPIVEERPRTNEAKTPATWNDDDEHLKRAQALLTELAVRDTDEAERILADVFRQLVGKRVDKALCGAKHYVDQSYKLPDIVQECALPVGHEGRHETTTGSWWERKASDPPPCLCHAKEARWCPVHRRYSCDSCAELFKYISEAKKEAQKRGRITGEPLAKWIASLPEDPFHGDRTDYPEAVVRLALAAHAVVNGRVPAVSAELEGSAWKHSRIADSLTDKLAKALADLGPCSDSPKAGSDP